VRPERMRIVNPMPRAVPPISIENDADVARNRVSLDLPDEPVFIMLDRAVGEPRSAKLAGADQWH
jgi:hypothetical protein